MDSICDIRVVQNILQQKLNTSFHDAECSCGKDTSHAQQYSNNTQNASRKNVTCHFCSKNLVYLCLFCLASYQHQMLQSSKHLSDLQEVSSRLRNVHQLSGSNGAFAALLEDGQIVTWGSPYAGGDSSGLQDRLCPDVRTEHGRIKLQ